MDAGELKKKAPWWVSMVAAFGVGGGGGSVTTFYWIDKIEARQASIEEKQVKVESQVVAAVLEMAKQVGKTNERLASLETAIKYLGEK